MTIWKVKIGARDKPSLKALTLILPIASNTLYPREQLIISISSIIVKGLYIILLDFPWIVNRLVRLRGTYIKLI